MNTQIKELAKQAGLNIDGYGYPIWGYLDGEDEKKEFLEKFAELIVRECAEVIQESRWMVPPSQKQLATSIKQHFGVEE